MKKFNLSSMLVRCLGLAIVVVMMAVGALRHSGKALGYDANPAISATTYKVTSSDTVVVNSLQSGKTISGYAGPVPVEVTIVDGMVKSVAALDNDETPRFFNRVTDPDNHLIDSWNGLSADSALALKVDGVSGATYSSNALISNVRVALSQYLDQKPKSKDSPISLVFCVALAVMLCAAILPIWTNNSTYRLVQLLVNVGVLGFWAGTFLDYTVILGFVASPRIATSTIITIIMLIVAFVYPIFGRNGHYCAWVCPLGSLQELASKIGAGHHIKMSAKTIKILTTMRWSIWGLLMVCLWTGILSSWIDYEPFSFFGLSAASWFMIVAGSAIIIISIFIPRPYCRFVCPTGSLLHWNETV